MWTRNINIIFTVYTRQYDLEMNLTSKISPF